MAFKLDMDELTLGEQEFICDQLGVRGLKQLAAVADEMPPRLLRVLAYLMKRKEDPMYTMEQTNDIKQSEFVAMFSDPNDEGDAGISSTGNTSDPSASPMDIRPKSSTRSTRKS